MKKFNHTIFYIAASVLFIASTIAAICGTSSGTMLGLGSLCLCLGVVFSEKSKDNKDNKENKDN